MFLNNSKILLIELIEQNIRKFFRNDWKRFIFQQYSKKGKLNVKHVFFFEKGIFSRIEMITQNVVYIFERF